MATLYAKNNHNWSARASSNWTLTQNGTDYQTPVDGDTLDANGRTVTLDANLTAAVITSSVAAGVFTTAADLITVTAQVGSSDGSALSVPLTFTGTSPKVFTVVGNIYGGSGTNLHGLSCATNATVNVTGNQTSGLTTGSGISFTGGGTLNVTGNQTAVGTSGDGINVATLAATATINGHQTGGASTGDGISWAVAGSLTINGNQTGGTASTATGLAVAGLATVNITGNQTGGTLLANYAVNITAAASVTINGTSTASASGIAINITNAGAVVTIDKIVGNGFGVGSSGQALVPTVNNTVASTLKIKEMEFGPLGACPVHGPVQWLALSTNTCVIYLTGGGTKTLLDSANAGTYPAGADVRNGVAYGSSQTGTAHIPAASSVAAGVQVDATVGTALVTAALLRAELAIELGRIDAAITSRNATTPPTAAAIGTQVRAELDTELARIDATISSRNATAPDNAGIAAIKAKTDNLPSDPADHSLIMQAIGEIGSGLSEETIEKLDAAELILLASTYVPTEVPVLVIPEPDPDETLTVVYIYTESITNVKRAGIEITLKLISTPAKSERVLEIAAKTMTTDADGYAAMTVQRNHRYRVTSRDLALNAIIEPTSETHDLLTEIS